MRVPRWRVGYLLIAVAVCGVVVLGLRYRLLLHREMETARRNMSAFEQAQGRAFAVIRQRPQWPESPEAVCRAFWEARAAEDYAEMEILWPGTTAAKWARICGSEPNVSYVFGPASEDGLTVPYAAKDRFDAHGTYSLTMRLQVLQTDKGKRYYIVSGN